MANRREYVLEIADEPLAADRRLPQHRLREAVAPRRPDGRERLARHAQRIDDDVIDGDVGEAEAMQDAERLPADAQVHANRVAELPRPASPQVVRVEAPRLEIDHQ